MDLNQAPSLYVKTMIGSKDFTRNQGWTHLGLSLTDSVVVWKSQLSWMTGMTKYLHH